MRSSERGHGGSIRISNSRMMARSCWYGFDPEFAQAYKFSARQVAAGQENAAKPGTCQNSAIVTVVADLDHMHLIDPSSGVVVPTDR